MGRLSKEEEFKTAIERITKRVLAKFLCPKCKRKLIKRKGGLKARLRDYLGFSATFILNANSFLLLSSSLKVIFNLCKPSS